MPFENAAEPNNSRLSSNKKINKRKGNKKKKRKEKQNKTSLCRQLDFLSIVWFVALMITKM